MLDFVDMVSALITLLIWLRCTKLCLLLTLRSVVFICYVCPSTTVQLLICFFYPFFCSWMRIRVLFSVYLSIRWSKLCYPWFVFYVYHTCWTHLFDSMQKGSLKCFCVVKPTSHFIYFYSMWSIHIQVPWYTMFMLYWGITFVLFNGKKWDDYLFKI